METIEKQPDNKNHEDFFDDIQKAKKWCIIFFLTSGKSLTSPPMFESEKEAAEHGDEKIKEAKADPNCWWSAGGVRSVCQGKDVSHFIPMPVKD